MDATRADSNCFWQSPLRQGLFQARAISHCACALHGPRRCFCRSQGRHFLYASNLSTETYDGCFSGLNAAFAVNDLRVDGAWGRPWNSALHYSQQRH